MAGRKARTRLQDENKRKERADRILDVAAALILRWGYNKTTIDDIAREAAVAKGTIYLHWKTREELFTALLQRERLVLDEDVKQRIASDPAGATLRVMIKHSALALMQRPLLKAVLVRDIDIIGRLIDAQPNNAAYQERLAGFTAYIEVLRERKLVRTDLSLRAQVYMLSAVFMGFFLLPGFVPGEFVLPDEEIAELLAETVHRALETERTISATDIEAVSKVFTEYVDRDMAVVEEQLRQGYEASTTQS